MSAIIQLITVALSNRFCGNLFQQQQKTKTAMHWGYIKKVTDCEKW